MFAAPLAPAMIPEDCSAENNSVTVAWQVPNHSFVEGYVLELDDGSGGEFRVNFPSFSLTNISFYVYTTYISMLFAVASSFVYIYSIYT